MNRIVPLKFFAAASLALGTLAATTAAQARDNVQFSVTLGSPGFLVQSAPVYVHPRPTYVRPAPAYVHPRPVYVQPQPVYMRPRPVYVQPAPTYGWGHQRYNHRGRNEYAQGSWGDYDRDGIPNRYDRFPGNPNRR